MAVRGDAGALYLLLNRLGFHHGMDRLKDAMALVFVGAFGGMLISATIGTGALWLVDAVRQGHSQNQAGDREKAVRGLDDADRAVKDVTASLRTLPRLPRFWTGNGITSPAYAMPKVRPKSSTWKAPP